MSKTPADADQWKPNRVVMLNKVLRPTLEVLGGKESENP